MDEEKNYWIGDILFDQGSGQDVRDPEIRNIFRKIFKKYLQASSCHEYIILVMHQGRITGQLDRKEATQERIMRFATNQER